MATTGKRQRIKQCNKRIGGLIHRPSVRINADNFPDVSRVYFSAYHLFCKMGRLLPTVSDPMLYYVFQSHIWGEYDVSKIT